MQKGFKALLLLIAGAIIFYGFNKQVTTKSHQLISQIQAETFTAFQAWIKLHNKHYREEQQFSYRFKRFAQNYKIIKEHNQRYEQGKQTFAMEINDFADISNQQFKYLYVSGYKPKKTHLGITKECTGKISILNNPPKQVDWTDKAVGPVRNQGSCGSCWAFSTCGSLQGLSAINSGKIPTFSPQQLVDCAGGPYENEGCNGGDMAHAMWYTRDLGIAQESKYPYKAKDQKCTYTSNMTAFKNKDCAQVPANKTIALQSAVAKQPVSIAVQASSLFFQFYSKGVFSGKCGIDLDHGIVLAGYGNLDGKDYWKCKNSWGADWGMKGYILIARGNDGPGQCGILMQNSVPLL